MSKHLYQIGIGLTNALILVALIGINLTHHQLLNVFIMGGGMIIISYYWLWIKQYQKAIPAPILIVGINGLIAGIATIGLAIYASLT